MLIVGFAGPVTDAAQCIPGGSRSGGECVVAINDLLTAAPNRDAVRALSQILLSDPFMGTSSLDTPSLVARALRVHASADPILALVTFTAVLGRSTFGTPHAQSIEGIVENYPRVSDRNLRDRARIELLAAADNASHPARVEATRAFVVIKAIDAVTPPAPPPPAPPPPAPGSDAQGRPSPWGAILLGVGMLALVGLALAGQRRGSLI